MALPCALLTLTHRMTLDRSQPSYDIRARRSIEPSPGREGGELPLAAFAHIAPQ
ncbi:hypothetical protein IMCC21224_113072 [Puniceibacterium sp. IMCC21224]|nr:hypothetical protein IMCC21224_113072 [Puniceibacterium sp. IMCC21224]